MPTRNARHGTLFTNAGIMHIGNECYAKDDSPIDKDCGCPTCRDFSRAYIRHLFKAREYLAGRLASMHNLCFYNGLTERIRAAIDEDGFEEFRREWSERLGRLM